MSGIPDFSKDHGGNDDDDGGGKFHLVGARGRSGGRNGGRSGGSGRGSAIYRSSQFSIASSVTEDTENKTLTAGTATAHVGNHNGGIATGATAMELEHINTQKKRSHSEDNGVPTPVEKTATASMTTKMDYQDTTKIGVYDGEKADDKESRRRDGRKANDFRNPS
jgi:hypothetical protein